MPTRKTPARDVLPIGIPWMGRGNASVNAAAANSARRPASDDRGGGSDRDGEHEREHPLVLRCGLCLDLEHGPRFVGPGAAPGYSRFELSLQSSCGGGRLSTSGALARTCAGAATSSVRAQPERRSSTLSRTATSQYVIWIHGDIVEQGVRRISRVAVVMDVEPEDDRLTRELPLDGVAPVGPRSRVGADVEDRRKPKAGRLPDLHLNLIGFQPVGTMRAVPEGQRRYA